MAKTQSLIRLIIWALANGMAKTQSLITMMTGVLALHKSLRGFVRPSICAIMGVRS
jgi:hypothetical protein